MIFRKLLFVMLIMVMCNVGAKPLGPNVSEYNGQKLKWEEGAWDYFVMFKSLLENNNRTVCSGAGCNLGDDQPNNPQADACIDKTVGSTYNLTSSYIPADAVVNAAYLVWITAQDPVYIDDVTDNAVTLSYTETNGMYDHTMDVVAGHARKLGEETSFEFEGSKTEYIPRTGAGQAIACSTDADCENNEQLMEGYQCISGECGTITGVYTYRKEVTDFFKTLHEKGQENDLSPGTSILGDYTVTGMDCTNHAAYLSTSGMVGGWSLVVIYTSETITAKKIYIYEGLEAYHKTSGEITVSGFELPYQPKLKITSFMAEGDPGLYDSGNFNLEGLYLHGQSNPAYMPLFNDCNPRMEPFLGQPYTEMFNSISSMIDLDGNLSCVGGLPSNMNPDLLEYAMDVDTMLLDSQFPPFNEHLLEGDTSINLKIGANQDQVYSNLLVLSIDTKAPSFDIPDEREKVACTCGDSRDSFCNEVSKPFYYAFKVQNHGENVAENVVVKDDLPASVKYVSGTAEMSKDNGVTWESIPDNGGFPFADGHVVIDRLEPCTNDSCVTVWARFQVELKAELSKKDTIQNLGEISATGVKDAYKTNTSIPLRLIPGNCDTSCVTPDLTECGGLAGCEDDSDCGAGKECDNGSCVDVSNFTTDAVVQFGKGVKSPAGGVIALDENNEKKDLAAGQFYLKVKDGGTEGSSFQFDQVNLRFDIGDNNVFVQNIRLYADTNESGTLDENDVKVGSVSSLNNQYATISVSGSARQLDSAKKHNFLVVVDAGYAQGLAISGDDARFNALIEGASAIKVSDDGDATAEGEKVEFGEYIFEPTSGFVFAHGENKPATPAAEKLNKGEHIILSIKTKSIDETASINQITISAINEAGGDFADFNNGISSLTLYLDNNGDLTPDKKLAKAEVISKSIATFKSLQNDLVYEPGKEIYLLVKANFNLAQGQSAQVGITDKSNIKKSVTGAIAGLPVKSEVLTYECEGGVCAEDDSGCSCSVASTESDSFPIFIIFSAFAALYFLRRKVLS